MNKIAKSIAAVVLAGTMGVGICATAACSKEVEVPGKSAYEIAVENGFNGTEAEWLESLKVTEQTTVVSYTVEYDVDEKGNKTATFTFTMSDGSKITKTEVLPASEVEVNLQKNSLIWTKQELAENKNSIAGMHWSVKYSNGSWGNVPLTADQMGKIYYEELQWVEDENGWYNDEENSYGHHETKKIEFDENATLPHKYKVDAQYNKIWSNEEYFEVYVVENLEGLVAEKSMLGNSMENSMGSSSDVACKIGGDALGSLYIATPYQIENESGGMDTYYRTCVVTEQMLDRKIDTSKTGNQVYTITYGEEEFELYVTVYDPSVTSVRYAEVDDDELNSIIVTAGKTTIATEAAKLVGKELYVSYYDKESEKVKITADMLDYSKVDDTKPGLYFMTVTYAGYAAKVQVLVNPDMTNANKTHTLNGMSFTVLSFMGSIVTTVDLYDNGYADVYVMDMYSGGDAVSLTTMYGYMTYTLANNVLEISFCGEKIAIYSADTENNTFGAYSFGEATATYTGVLNMGEESPYTLKTYANGYAEFIMGAGQQVITVILGYTKDGNDLKIAPFELMGLKFIIGENNTLTDNFEEMY